MAAVKHQWGYGLPDQAVLPEPQPAAEAAQARSGARWLAQIRGDVAGSFAAAVLTIPVSMGYGLLALSPLGEQYTAYAILAGLYAPVCGCIVAVLLGANTTMIYSPRSIVTFLIGSLVLHNFVRSSAPFIQSADPALLLSLIFLLIFLAGLVQALFGMMRLGNLVKYIPAPVVAGFQNAAAVLIFFAQLDAMLGFTRHVPLLEIPSSHFGEIQPLTLLVGGVTCAVALNGAKLTKRIPPSILGFIAGVTSYYLLAAAGLGSVLGPRVGEIPFSWPSPHYLGDFAAVAFNPQIFAVLPALVTGAVSLAIVASLDGLLCARLVESDSGNKVNGNKELVRLGIGNMVSASFGGIANGINLGSSFANHRSGARTPVSVLVHGTIILLGILALSPLIAYLPRVVIAAMLSVVAIQLVDRWTLQICRKLISGEITHWKSMALDLFVILLVATVAVAVNIVLAVIIGIAVAILFFLFRMSKSVIRRAYRCDAVHSRKNRDPRLTEILAQHGRKILVLELEGPIFFGTAENLANYVETAQSDDVAYVIFDLKRVNEIDSTGAKIVLQTHDRLTGQGKHLLVSCLEEHTQLANFLKDMGVTTALSRTKLFQDTDRAIEWAEDHLILSQLSDLEMGQEFPFHQFDVLARMTDDEMATIKTMLIRRTYAKGEFVFREGDEGTELFIIAKGSASVRIKLPGEDRETRLITFSAGTVFGEVALLDQEARSASIQADEDLVCYVLPQASFAALAREHPAIAIKLLSNLGRELSGRLRRANRTIYQLAS